MCGWGVRLVRSVEVLSSGSIVSASISKSLRAMTDQKTECSDPPNSCQ